MTRAFPLPVHFPPDSERATPQPRHGVAFPTPRSRELTSSADIDNQAPVHHGAAAQLLGRRHRVDGLLLAVVADLGAGPRARRAVQAAERHDTIGNGKRDAFAEHRPGRPQQLLQAG